MTCSCRLTKIPQLTRPRKVRGEPNAASRHDRNHASDRLLRPAAEIVDQAYLTARLAGQASVPAMQDQPVMRMQHEFGRNDFFKTKLDLERRLAWREAGA